MHAVILLATAAFTIAPAESTEREIPQPESTTHFTIMARAADNGPATFYYQVASAANLDGDGRADTGMLKVTCADGRIAAASYRYHEWRWHSSSAAPATGDPVGAASDADFAKSWEASSPELQSMKVGYDLKQGTKLRLAAPGATPDKWRELTLTDAAGLCGDAVRATNLNSSKSN